MILQSIKLQGYRTFAKSTFLEFSENVTSILGPEGCGKTNLLRAIQAPFSKEEDDLAIRFAGSDTRDPAESASITISWLDETKQCSIRTNYLSDGSKQNEVLPTEYDLKKITTALTYISSLNDLEEILNQGTQRILLIEEFICEDISKFVKLIKEASIFHQVIIITSYKAVLPLSGLMVGVTMEEYGISSLLKMKLTEN